MDMDKTAAIGVMEPAEATQGIATPAANATQMAMNVECPVCRTANPPSETYCIDCGFLLTGQPVEIAEMPEMQEVGRLITPDGTREFPLKPGENSVGRESADVLLSHNTVSRKHASVTVEDGKVIVADAGSTNGTYVDGKKLEPGAEVELKDGSDVVFGSFSLRYQAAAESEEQRVESEEPADVEACEAAVEPEDVAEQEDEAVDTEEPVADVVGWLVAKDGSCRLEIHSGTNTVGRRAADNDIDIPDPYCSGRHADLIYEDGTFTITDVGSTNGTLVNGVKLDAGAPRELAANDEITLGQMAFVLEVA